MRKAVEKDSMSCRKIPKSYRKESKGDAKVTKESERGKGSGKKEEVKAFL